MADGGVKCILAVSSFLAVLRKYSNRAIAALHSLAVDFLGNPCSLAEILEERDSHVAEICRGALRSQVAGLKVAVVEAVKEEIHQIRHHCLGALGFQQLHNVVVGQR